MTTEASTSSRSEVPRETGRVSWLIPVRDGADWIAAAVDSALAECGEGDEVIVVDDGSRDGGVQGLRSHPRLLRLEQPAQGIVAALEHGRRAARGRFIARLDADDLALPGRIDAQLSRLEAEPGLAAIGGRARLLAAPGTAANEGMRLYVDWLNGLADPQREILVESPLFHPAVTFRAAAVEAVGGYRDGDHPEDYDLWLRLVEAGHAIANVDREVVVIRDHAARLTRTDSRYDREAFDRCRKRHLRCRFLDRPRRILVWCGRKGGRPWLRWLASEGHEIAAVIDIVPGTRRAGIPVRPPEALLDTRFDLLLVSVGARAARDLIRREIARLRPDLVEGRDWLALR